MPLLLSSFFLSRIRKRERKQQKQKCSGLQIYYRFQCLKMTLISDNDYYSFFFSVHLTRSLSLCRCIFVPMYLRCESLKCNGRTTEKQLVTQNTAEFVAQHSITISIACDLNQHLICNLHGYLHYYICLFICSYVPKKKTEKIIIKKNPFEFDSIRSSSTDQECYYRL